MSAKPHEMHPQIHRILAEAADKLSLLEVRLEGLHIGYVSVSK